MFAKIFHPFFDWFDFHILSHMSCLYVWEINSLMVASFANIFFHSEGCLFVSCAVQKLLSLIRSQLYILIFTFTALGGRF